MLLLLGAGEAAAAATPAARPFLLVIPPRAGDAKLFSATEVELGRSDRYRVVLLPALLPLMRQADDQALVRRRSSTLVEEGRQLLVSLDHQRARASLEAALKILEESFLRYYDPRPVAQVRVLLGISALQRARPDLARQEFVEAHHLDPALTLDAHYSPQVRAAFLEARQGLPPRPAPGAAELRKLLALSGAPAAVVLDVEPAGERALIRGALFVGARAAYTGVESTLVETASPAGGAAALGVQLRRLAEASYPAPSKPPPLLGRVGRLKPPPPPPPARRPPWYRRWYTWTAAGAVVAGVVGLVLPLTIKREVVDSTVRW